MLNNAFVVRSLPVALPWNFHGLKIYIMVIKYDTELKIDEYGKIVLLYSVIQISP